ncbi:hypothetical protein CBR_g28907 [Chara braunii]|uniref:DUF659 domain-containing protein n=1 Tax=Chara braunii TaxID=69332 RepID=A0A388LA56_CHABU|nr:hypothetical protein CBR_g28907 [Chara braunii]|eukprot:GBG79190.1 hypothetical protein CBR_g28907 [Chara braunii]
MPKPPTYHMVRTTLLDELDADVQRCVKPVLETSRHSGCIMTDGWTNIRGQTLCNYLACTERGPTYLATDVMRGKKDATALAKAWLQRLKTIDIQLSDITTFVTDSAGVNMSAMEIFQEDESVKHIFWIPCVAHVMDLVLEDIGSIGWVASRIAQARLITKFFKRHSHACEALEAKTKLKLLLPAETRFGTNVIMIRRLLELQTHLMQVVTEDPWRDTVWATRKIRQHAAEISACAGSPPWWEDLKGLLRIMDPVMEMLQMLDSDTRHISKDEILEVFDRRRTMFRTPAHIATMMLDPEFRDPTLADDGVMQEGLKIALVQFGYPEGSPRHKEVLTVIDKFHAKEKPFESATMDRAMTSYEHPSTGDGGGGDGVESGGDPRGEDLGAALEERRGDDDDSPPRGPEAALRRLQCRPRKMSSIGDHVRRCNGALRPIVPPRAAAAPLVHVSEDSMRCVIRWTWKGAASHTPGGEGRLGGLESSGGHAQPANDVPVASSTARRTDDGPATRNHSAPPAPVLPTSSFYDWGRAGATDGATAAWRSACAPTDVPLGTRSIGVVDSRRHGAMREYADQHGRRLATKTSDVAFTRVWKASMSRARNKAGPEGSSLHLSRHDASSRDSVHGHAARQEIAAHVGGPEDGQPFAGGTL